MKRNRPTAETVRPVGAYPQIPAIDPYTEQSCELKVSTRLMEDVKRHSTIRLYELCHLVPEAVKEPIHVYRGLRDAKEDDGLCYVHKARYSFRPPAGKRVPEPWPGELFVVFVNEDRVIYNFTWVESDPDDPECPEDAVQRFGERIF